MYIYTYPAASYKNVLDMNMRYYEFFNPVS